MEAFTRAQVVALIEVEADTGDPFVRRAIRLLDEWTERGDGCAVYRNEDLGHPQMGHLKFASFGGPVAMFRDPPPSRLPDMPGEINWRYALIGTYRKET